MQDIIISGSNGGMGRNIIEKLSPYYRIFALDINPNTPSTNVIPIAVDMTDESSVNNAMFLISTYTDSIYAIINLVGTFGMDSIVEGDEIKLRKIMEVNFWAVYRTNKAFFPLLNKGSRIINMSSEVARYSMHPFDGYYALSKVMTDSYTDVLRRECAFIGVKVIKIQAGSFATNMTAVAEKEFNSLKNRTQLFPNALTFYDKFVLKELQKSHNPQIMADKIAKILRLKNPRICYRVRNSFKLRLLNALPDCMQDRLYIRLVKIFGKKTK